MKTPRTQILFTCILILCLAFGAQAYTVSTYIGNGADLELNEQNYAPRAGDTADLNARHRAEAGANFRNDVVGLRFDLSEHDLTDMTNVTLNVVNYRDNTPRVIDVYAIDQGATGDTGTYDTETWGETNLTVWGDFPGLLTTDGTNATTISIDTNKATLLVDGQSIGASEGSTSTLSSSELTTYVQGFAGSSSITFLVAGGESTSGQLRFASKDATNLTTIVGGTNGQWAPFLEFDLISEMPTNLVALVADADTSIQEHTPSSTRATGSLLARSMSVRQHIAYIRFDLSVLADAPGTGAVFSVTTHASQGGSFSEGDLHVYGLRDMAGNTPQAWVDSGLSYNTSGDEVPADGDASTQDLDPGRVQYLGDTPGAASRGTTVSLTSTNLDTFLSDRYAHGGLATLMLVSEANADREMVFNNSENTNAPVPTLVVEGERGGSTGDITPPTVAFTRPRNGTADVAWNAEVKVTFSEPMDPATVTSDSVFLQDESSSGVPVHFAFNENTLTATLTPIDLLDPNDTYTINVTTDVTDLATNAMEAAYSSSFTTGVIPPVDNTRPIALVPDADTYLTNDERDGPDDRFGGGSTYEVRWHEARVHIGYLRYDIRGVDPALFGAATLRGHFTDSSRNGAGTWNVYGLNDDADGNFWNELSVNYSTAAGVAPAPINSFVITNATLLGTIALDGIDEQPLPFASNPMDLPLASFLEADTDGLVTFLIQDASQSGTEWRLNAKEGTTADGHGPTTLNFELPFRITDVHLAAGPSIVVFWEGDSDHSYGVERTADNRSATNWVPVASNLVGAATNTYVDAAPTEANVSYRVLDEGEIPPTVLFFEDFEGASTNDWIVTNYAGATSWEIGSPINYGGGTTGYSVPPSGPLNGANAAGTDLDADYAPSTQAGLLSPVIDLTGVTAADLSFGNYYDTEGFDVDFCEVYVRDASGAEITGTALTNSIAFYQGLVAGEDWIPSMVPLPPEAMGRSIRLEFYFESDTFTEYSGWYIDDVQIAE